MLRPKSPQNSFYGSYLVRFPVTFLVFEKGCFPTLSEGSRSDISTSTTKPPS